MESTLNDDKWFVYRKTDHHLAEEILNAHGQTICIFPKYHGNFNIDDLEVNARVISCAPEMVSLLEEISECLCGERYIDADLQVDISNILCNVSRGRR